MRIAWRCCALGTVALFGLLTAAHAEPLKIAYSDWPGWVAWEIAIQKNRFKEAGVDVQFMWYDYAPSMDAYSTGKADAVCMTNGDALVTGSSGKPSVGILVNDMIVAKLGIDFR